MATITEYMANLDKAIKGIRRQTATVINSEKERILDLNRETQLFEQGITAKGGKIVPPYSPFTIEIKQQRNAGFGSGRGPRIVPTAFVSLFDQGNFYRGFKLQYDPDLFTITIYSTDEKTPKLIEKYSADIFGLTKDNRDYLDFNIIKPAIDKWVYSQLK
jgi:hypothetical protein